MIFPICSFSRRSFIRLSFVRRSLVPIAASIVLAGLASAQDGIDVTWKGKPFDTGAPPAELPEPAPELIPITEKQTAKILDAPLCYQCGSKMQPAGSCYVCTTCGSTSGCS